MSSNTNPHNPAHNRSHWLASGALLLIILLCWLYLATGAGTGMDTVAMSEWRFPLPRLHSSDYNPWNTGHSLIMFFMWWIMMIAMMLPSASPTILLYGRLVRHYGILTSPSMAVGLFTSGYCLAWAGFSLLAVIAHAALEHAGVVHTMMMWITVPAVSASLLVGAGLYQLSPWKQACLRHCQSPAAYISGHWRAGHVGALRMGLEHGLYCLGCCWMLMLLLFVGGAMNLFWILGLALWVLLEKVLPANRVMLPLSAALLIGAGFMILLLP